MVDNRFALGTTRQAGGHLWDAAVGKPIGAALDQSGVRAVGFSPDGKVMLTGSYDKKARLERAAAACFRAR